MHALSGLKKLSGLLGLVASLGVTPAVAQHAGDNWVYGEDLNAGQLVLRYKIGASVPASLLCFRDHDTIELSLRLPAQNLTPGQLITAQVVMDTKPYQLSTDRTFEKDGMLEARFNLPAKSDFMDNAIASTQMQFGIPGQQYQTVYFPPSKEMFANFNGKCLWMKSNAQAQNNQQPAQTQASQQATTPQTQQPANNPGSDSKYAEWKLFPGTNRNAQFHITNPNDGNQIVMFCTPQNPNIIHAYIKHGKAYTEQRKITLNSVGYVTLKMHHNITGTTTQNGIYLALKHDDPHWGVIGNASTYSVNGAQIASFPIDAFGSSFYDELGEFRRQCGTTQAHKDAITAAMKPHADKALKAAQNGQDAFIDLNAVSVGQTPVQQATSQQQQVTTQQTQQNTPQVQQTQPSEQQNANGGTDSLQQGLNKLGQVVQLGQQIVGLKNQLQGSNTQQQAGSSNTGQQLPTLQQQQPAQQAPSNQQTTYSNLVNYKCENAAQFQVRYEGGNDFDRAVLIMNGIQPVILPSVPSGSGVKYFNGQIEWHTKGPDGILKQNGKELVCEDR